MSEHILVKANFIFVNNFYCKVSYHIVLNESRKVNGRRSKEKR